MLDAERTSQFNQTFNAIPGIMFAGTIYAVDLTIGTAVFLLVSSEVVSFERFVTSDSLVEELVSVFGTICNELRHQVRSSHAVVANGL